MAMLGFVLHKVGFCFARRTSLFILVQRITCPCWTPCWVLHLSHQCSVFQQPLEIVHFHFSHQREMLIPRALGGEGRRRGRKQGRPLWSAHSLSHGAWEVISLHDWPAWIWLQHTANLFQIWLCHTRKGLKAVAMVLRYLLRKKKGKKKRERGNDASLLPCQV